MILKRSWSFIMDTSEKLRAQKKLLRQNDFLAVRMTNGAFPFWEDSTVTS